MDQSDDKPDVPEDIEKDGRSADRRMMMILIMVALGGIGVTLISALIAALP